MTITTLETRNEYTATAGQTVFNYTFKIFASTDLSVYQTPAGNDADDSTDLITGYSVSGLGDENGGSITLNVGASVGDLITIVSSIPESRTTDYQNNGDFKPSVVNEDFDRVISLAKQAIDMANRALLLQESQQGSKPFTLPGPQSGNVLVWKGTLDGMENRALGTADVIINIPIQLLSDFTDLADAISSIGSTVIELWIDDSETLSASATTHANTTVKYISGNLFSDDANNANLIHNGPVIAAPDQQLFNWGNGSGAVSFGAKSVEKVYPDWWGENTTPGTTDMTNEVVAAITTGEDVKLLGVDYLTSSNLLFSSVTDQKISGVPGSRIIGQQADTKMEFRDSTGLILRDFDIDGATTPGGTGNQGLTIRRCSDVRVENVNTSNVSVAGILVFTDHGEARSSNVIIENCKAEDGTVGILLARMDDSSIINCIAKNQSGSPGFGLELKNQCRRCQITGGSVEGCSSTGLTFGLTDPDGVEESTVSNVSVKDCGAFFEINDGINNKVNNILGVGLTVGSSIIIKGAAAGNTVEATVEDAVNNVVVFKDTANLNTVNVLSRGTTGSHVVYYESGTANNTTNVSLVEDVSGISGVDGLSNDDNISDTGNRTYYKRDGVEAVVAVNNVVVTHNEKYIVTPNRVKVAFDTAPVPDTYTITSIDSAKFTISFFNSAVAVNYTGNVLWSFE